MYTKDFLYKLAPITLAVVGTAAMALILLLESYIKDSSLTWSIIFFVMLMFGLLSGRIIQKLHQGACTDSLTGLWNRRYFDMRLTEEIERSKRSKSSLCLALIDADNLKEVNDQYGHSVGDELIQKLADVLHSNTRPFDTAARWGGDEFAVIFPDTDAAGALAVAERVREVFENNNFYQTTISIGIMAVDSETEVKAVLQMADHALYKAKQKKNIIAVCNSLGSSEACGY